MKNTQLIRRGGGRIAGGGNFNIEFESSYSGLDINAAVFPSSDEKHPSFHIWVSLIPLIADNHRLSEAKGMAAKYLTALQRNIDKFGKDYGGITHEVLDSEYVKRGGRQYSRTEIDGLTAFHGDKTESFQTTATIGSIEFKNPELAGKNSEQRQKILADIVEKAHAETVKELGKTITIDPRWSKLAQANIRIA